MRVGLIRAALRSESGPFCITRLFDFGFAADRTELMLDFLVQRFLAFDFLFLKQVVDFLVLIESFGF